ncbi:2Fe-2S iron-sulfur cluster binding domain-containing protein [bacterium]|nr:2Fe-2S iron-sulfur cluster binding domain-containing protein [bacterium]
MAEKVTLVYNGRPVETEAGKPLIALSRELGDEIPHFCYHPGLGVDGNCRMCLIELTGSPNLVPGCTLSAAAGMEVTTNSESVRKARQGVLEFILINHPLDCPICDKGGECPLQETTRRHGPAHSRLADPKNTAVKHRVIGEHIIFDAERCILCSRCVRYQRDVAGREELMLRMRGDRVVVDIFEERPLTSGFTGNLADICPVGALTTREFRFQARPWEMRAVATACGGCSLHCAATSWWKGAVLQRLTADVDHAVNDWWLCDKGRFGYAAERGVAECLVRRQGVQVPVSPAEAAAQARALLAAAQQPLVLAGSLATDEELAACAALARQLRIAVRPFPAAPAELDFLPALGRSGLELDSLAGLGRLRRVLVLGEDPELAHPILALRLLGGVGGQAPGEVVLVQAPGAPWAPPGDGSRHWSRVEADPAAWLDGEGAALLAGEESLLVAVSASLVRRGALDARWFAALGARRAETRLLWLLPGLNRRRLLAAAAAWPGPDPLASLQGGEADVVFAFGLDPAADFPEPARGEQALDLASGALILQCDGLEAARAAAAVVLARRAPVDLVGTVTNTWGRSRSLRSWHPVAGRRPLDSDWFAPLLAQTATDKLEVAGRHEG